MKMYDPYMFGTFLRKYAPGINRLGIPPKARDTYSMQQLRDKKFNVARTKDEVVEEYSMVMRVVYQRVVLGALAVIVGLYAFMQLLSTGNEFFLAAAMVAVAWGMYKWWHSGAAYSNYQQFELRPVLVPVEDIREQSIIPYWLTGEKPTFKAGAGGGGAGSKEGKQGKEAKQAAKVKGED